MVKFILVIWLCSAVAQDCKPILTPVADFDSYKNCVIYGYQHTIDILKAMPEEEIDRWKIFTRFICKEGPEINT